MKLIELDTCDSTNDEAWEHLPGPALIMTRQQLKGRGREGRAWESGASAGNLFASLLLPVPRKNPGLFLRWLPLAAGVAAAETLVEEKIGSGLRLKWPNDVCWENAKLGGILCESKIAGENFLGVVVGIGLNIVSAPKLETRETTFLEKHTKASHSRQAIGRRWAEKLSFWAELLAAESTASLREAWLGFARLKEFSALVVKNHQGANVEIDAFDLDNTGRLVGRVRATGEIVCLDQAESL